MRLAAWEALKKEPDFGGQLIRSEMDVITDQFVRPPPPPASAARATLLCALARRREAGSPLVCRRAWSGCARCALLAAQLTPAPPPRLFGVRRVCRAAQLIALSALCVSTLYLIAKIVSRVTGGPL